MRGIYFIAKIKLEWHREYQVTKKKKNPPALLTPFSRGNHRTTVPCDSFQTFPVLTEAAGAVLRSQSAWFGILHLLLVC